MAVLFAVISLLLFTISSLLFRSVAGKIRSTDTLGMLYTTLAGIFSLPLLLIERDFTLPTNPKGLLIFVAIAGWATYSYFSAWVNYHYKASVNAILGQVTTVFSLLLGVFVLQEVLSVPQIIGVSAILLGNIALAWTESDVKLNKQLLMRVGLSFVLAMNFMLDNVVSPLFNRSFYIFIVYFIPGLLIWFLVPAVSWKSIKETMQEHWKEVSALSLLSLVGYYSLLTAYDAGKLSLVIPILQSATVTTVLAAAFFLKERENMVFKILTGIVVTVGVIIVSFAS